MIDNKPDNREGPMATTSAAGRTEVRARRILAIAVSACIVLIAVGAAAAMAIGVVTSMHNGLTEIALRFNDADGFGRSSGVPGGVRAQAIVTETIVAIPGLSPLTVGLHLTGGVLATLAPLAIGWFAARLGVGLWRGRPFAAPVARDLLIASAALFGLSISSQLLLWLSQLAALSELPYGGGIGQFSYWPEFDPFLPATALGLLIVALAFPLGSRAARLTEGLI
jgi:hypothetical protein